MGKSSGKFQGIKDKMSKENIILVLIIMSPLILTIIFSVIGDIDARKTQERLNNRPTTTWRDILTPEERKNSVMGFSASGCNSSTSFRRI